MLRPESKARARALQLLYAWEMQPGEQLSAVATRAATLCPRKRGAGPILDRAEAMAVAVAEGEQELDRKVAAAADNWRLGRLGTVDRIILRLGIRELGDELVPPKVAIDEAVWLAHMFGGAKSAAFVNGVLDRVARSLGRL